MSQNKIQETRIVICERCKGEGSIQVATGDADRCRIETCAQCRGTRVMKQITTVEFFPIKEEYKKS